MRHTDSSIQTTLDSTINKIGGAATIGDRCIESLYTKINHHMSPIKTFVANSASTASIDPKQQCPEYLCAHVKPEQVPGLLTNLSILAATWLHPKKGLSHLLAQDLIPHLLIAEKVSRTEVLFQDPNFTWFFHSQKIIKSNKSTLKHKKQMLLLVKRGLYYFSERGKTPSTLLRGAKELIPTYFSDFMVNSPHFSLSTIDLTKLSSLNKNWVELLNSTYFNSKLKLDSETCLAWFIIYKLFELRAGYVFPILLPPTKELVTNCLKAILDVLELASIFPCFASCNKNKARCGSDNWLLKGLTSLPMIKHLFCFSTIPPSKINATVGNSSIDIEVNPIAYDWAPRMHEAWKTVSKNMKKNIEAKKIISSMYKGRISHEAANQKGVNALIETTTYYDDLAKTKAKDYLDKWYVDKVVAPIFTEFLRKTKKKPNPLEHEDPEQKDLESIHLEGSISELSPIKAAFSKVTGKSFDYVMIHGDPLIDIIDVCVQATVKNQQLINTQCAKHEKLDKLVREFKDDYAQKGMGYIRKIKETEETQKKWLFQISQQSQTIEQLVCRSALLTLNLSTPLYAQYKHALQTDPNFQAAYNKFQAQEASKQQQLAQRRTAKAAQQTKPAPPNSSNLEKKEADKVGTPKEAGTPNQSEAKEKKDATPTSKN